MEKNLRDVMNMMISFYMMTTDIGKAYCSEPEYTAEELIENISFDLRSIAEYHFGEGESVGVDDDEDAARAFIDVLSNIIEFMTNFIDPTMLMHCLHDNNTRVSKDLIKMFSHDGIDTIDAVESVARAYKVLGECAYDAMKYNLNRTSLDYFDTDTIYAEANKRSKCHIVTQERGFGEKYANMEEGLRRLKQVLRSTKSSINQLSDIAHIVKAIDDANGIDTTGKDGE